VATGNLLLVVGIALGALPSLYARARAEEALLRERFGAAYGRYADEVPMLVPGLRPRGQR
jgi:protein-S-isoprenylcysteine O-methyltransferase Ste14